jgi:hypothetical protein
MKGLTRFRTIAAFCALAALAWAGQAYAVEPGDTDPHEPGASAGAPLGALPPPGFYYVNNLNYVSGSLNGGNGEVNKAPNTTVNITAWVEIPILLWSSPFHILGAQSGANMIQAVVTGATTTNGKTTNKTGLDNTTITPLILSWQLPAGFFVSTALPIGIDDGDNEANAGGGTLNVSHTAADYWIISPSVDVAWFNGHGTQLTLNTEFDIQGRDNNFENVGGLKVGYQSGDFLTMDIGALQTLPGPYRKWTVGVVGFFATQVQPDRLSGATIPGTQFTPGTVPANFLGAGNSAGNEFQKFGLGPSVAYNFGPVSMNVYFTRDLYAKNTTENSTFWWAVAVPF